MPNNLYNRYGNGNTYKNSGEDIKTQLMRLKNNPGWILDILLQRDKITQQQYNDLQKYRNDPQSIVQYLINNGKASQINQAEQLAKNSINQNAMNQNSNN